MKIFINSLMILAGAVIGLTVGFALKKPAQTRGIAIEARHAGGARVESSGVRRAGSLFNTKYRTVLRSDDSPWATKLERDLSMSSSVTRWLYWLEALEKASPADCLRLAQLAKGNSTLVWLVGRRWAEINPQHMFQTLLSGQIGSQLVGELQRVLFEEWLKKDINGAIAALDKSDGSGLQQSWRRSFASSLVLKDPERGLRLMSEWNIDNHGPQMTGVKKWAAANPRHAAEFALAHPAGSATRYAMETIGQEWARTDPEGALQFAVAQRGEFSFVLASAVLKSWTDRDLHAASAWLAQADANTRNRLSPAFVEGWGKYDAPSALKWCEANLSGITFANAAAGLVRGAANTDLAGAADLVTSMPPSRARSEAAGVVMQKWLPNYPSDTVPSEATAWLSGLDSASINRVLEYAQWRWSEADPKGFAVFVASLKPEQVPSQAYSTLARSMARINPLEALEWANRLPEERRISIGIDAFVEWQRSQPKAAREWLSNVPLHDPRRDLFFQNVVSSMAFDPLGADQLAAMHATDRAIAEKLIGKMVLPEDRRTALLNALKSK